MARACSDGRGGGALSRSGARQIAELKIGAVFEPLAGLNPLHSSLFAQPSWEGASTAFTTAMVPIERIVARTLASRFAASGLKGHGLLREFMRYGELVRRELVFRELAPSRESLLGQLEHDLEVGMRSLVSEPAGLSTRPTLLTCCPGSMRAVRMQLLREDFETRSGQAGGRRAHVGKNLPNAVESLVLARQVGSRR